MVNEITIITDTRENKPWIFEKERKSKTKTSLVVGNETLGLDCGDYTFRTQFKDYSNLFRIEKKASLQEIYGNIICKEPRERFERELEKLRSIKYRYILIESNINKDVLGMAVPQIKWGPPISKVFKQLEEYELDYGVHFRTVGDAGAKYLRYLIDLCISRE